MAAVARRSATRSASSSSTCSESTPARSASASWCRSSTSQPTVSHHLKVLRDAGIVGSERRGLWAYYYVNPESLRELTAWLG